LKLFIYFDHSFLDSGIALTAHIDEIYTTRIIIGMKFTQQESL